MKWKRRNENVSLVGDEWKRNFFYVFFQFSEASVQMSHK